MDYEGFILKPQLEIRIFKFFLWKWNIVYVMC